MGIDHDVNQIFKRMDKVHPNFEGKIREEYMRNYLKTAILLYEQIKEDQRLARLKYPEIPLSWNPE